MKRVIIAFFLLLVMAASVYFSIANFTSVSINYFFGEFELPLAVLVIATFIVGILFGLLADVWLIFKYRSDIKRLKKQAESSASELKNLRNLPIKDLS